MTSVVDRRRFLLTSLASLTAPPAAEAQQASLPLVALVQGQFAQGDYLPSPLEVITPPV
jgi:hypothetical protein